MIHEGHAALGVVLTLGAHETLTHDAGTLDGAGEFRHDRFPPGTALAGLPGPLRFGWPAGRIRGVQSASGV